MYKSPEDMYEICPFYCWDFNAVRFGFYLPNLMCSKGSMVVNTISMRRGIWKERWTMGPWTREKQGREICEHVEVRGKLTS